MIFSDKYLYCIYNDKVSNLKNKLVFAADDIYSLQRKVEEGKELTSLKGRSSFEHRMFGTSNGDWNFIYYDPNYDIKVAYENGEDILYKSCLSDSWRFLEKGALINWENPEYIFKIAEKYKTSDFEKAIEIMNGVKVGVEKLIHKLENKELITTKDWRDCFKEMDDARNTCGILEGLTDFSR